MTTQRIRGRKLQRIRDAHFRRHPLCVRCEERGRVRPATQLDHKIPLFKGGQDVEANRQGLCDDCHEQKTREDMGHGASSACDARGLPKDPRHPWNHVRN